MNWDPRFSPFSPTNWQVQTQTNPFDPKATIPGTTIPGVTAPVTGAPFTPSPDGQVLARGRASFAEQQMMMFLAQQLTVPPTTDPNSLLQDPSLQFDPAHMNLDPNCLAQQLGLPQETLEQLGVDTAHCDPTGQTGQTGGPSEELLQSATDKARKIHEAIDQGAFGWGTDEGQLRSTIAGLTNEEKEIIGGIYQDMYGSTIEDDIRGDTSGHSEGALLEMLKPQSNDPAVQSGATRDAASLYDAMHGAGTDEGRVFAALTGKSPDQVRMIAQTYEQNYGESLRDAIKNDFSGGFLGIGGGEHELLAILDQAGVP